MRRGSLGAYVTFISKEGKDATLCFNYRLKALLNSDTKLFAKVLATK